MMQPTTMVHGCLESHKKITYDSKLIRSGWLARFGGLFRLRCLCTF
jgi:hypothetical protein